MNEPEAVPAPVASALVLPLPIVELMVAGSLVSTASVAWGTLGALLLLLAFIVAIVLNLARGRAPECRCFGQFSTSPIGWTTLVRNVSLVALTGSIAWRGPGPSPSEWFGDLTAAQRIGFVTGSVLVTLLAAEGWLLFLVLHQNGRILLRLDELEVQLRVGGRARQRAHRVAGLPIGATGR